MKAFHQLSNCIHSVLRISDVEDVLFSQNTQQSAGDHHDRRIFLYIQLFYNCYNTSH